nr:metal-dependent hydrolase [uncultured Carboxylicivirga sp.]
MDIITHGLTGLALSTTIMATRPSGKLKKLCIGLTGLIGGVLPDLDVLSKWKGFDTTFGNWFNLKQSGNAIFADTHWYSHHALGHSVIGALFLTLLLSLVYVIYTKLRGNYKLQNTKWYALAFLMGYMGHLFEDMITPGGPWKGIAFFWPIAHYSGGWGKIWWWNNYDLFLIVVAALTINLTLVITRYRAALLTKITIVAALVLFTIQVEQRNYDFNQGNNQEQISKELQQKYLGKGIYQFMKTVDDAIPVAF